MLEKEYEYFEKNKDRLISEHQDEYVVIVGEEIIGFYVTQEEAITEAQKQYTPGEFLVQKCSPESDQIMRFHSRIVLS